MQPRKRNPVLFSAESTALADDSEFRFQQDVLAGLAKTPKHLPCKYFYDERGSKLFDEICELDSYYPTRTETQIMIDNADAIGRRIGAGAVLVEYGSGSSTKTRKLLDHLPDPTAYIPVDISEGHLLMTADRLRLDYPDLDIHPIVADFTQGFDLPEVYRDAPLTVYFPGSTIGNLESSDAVDLLGRIAGQCNAQGGLLIGVDLDKDEQVLLDAYDDNQGVTAEFNRNLLHRINRELNANFAVERFKHVAIYNRGESRMELYLESCVEQVVVVGDSQFAFRQGERILTEYSHKYNVTRFAELALQAGLGVDEVWTDANGYFAVMHFSAL
ncbi:Histidine-specific methyltransferase EgtD [Rosistilla carotiformis]|uniref:Histidine-specific methyltransferase EgtD n=1 Tax=Rosistilla carotiformis TaxID=2528017 RepID=A0A518JWF8_9BACT|nr:L-histidine N(alpha)-methyltransferase [Rosistilla carotiformis]QDV69879.1 Histidine-specific methyltransferase EgtD [Rosistilla carotiformis]